MNNKNRFLIGAAILIIGASIILNGYFIGVAIKTIQIKEDNSVLNLSQAANYMNITEAELQGIIKTEQYILDKTGRFSGFRLPHLKINDRFYFYTDELDDWLKEACLEHKNYDTTNLQISQE